MPPNSYKFVYDEYGNTEEIKVHARGIGVHSNNYVNKGTAFSDAERNDLGMDGSLPPAVSASLWPTSSSSVARLRSRRLPKTPV